MPGHTELSQKWGLADQERGISVLEQERCVLQKVVANDCSRRVMCRMDGEGAVKRERLVTDTVSRREVQ